VQVHKIQAAVLRKRGGPLKIEVIEMEGPQDDEVLVRIVATGIWLQADPVEFEILLTVWTHLFTSKYFPARHPRPGLFGSAFVNGQLIRLPIRCQF
jgi:hypothetical protein